MYTYYFLLVLQICVLYAGMCEEVTQDKNLNVLIGMSFYDQG